MTGNTHLKHVSPGRLSLFELCGRHVIFGLLVMEECVSFLFPRLLLRLK